MSKISFSKLKLTKNNEVTIIHFNEEIEIEVKQYLPSNEKLELISNVINLAQTENYFYNPLKVEIYFVMEVINKYTNITFTDKQKEDISKLYDLFVGSGLSEKIFNAIPEDEIMNLKYFCEKSVKTIYDYMNSLRGIMETVSQDYSNADFNATEIYNKLADPENLDFLKEVLGKLG